MRNESRVDDSQYPGESGTAASNEGVRTYWLSFCDGDRDVGSQFLGAVVVDVARDELGRGVVLSSRATNTEALWIEAALIACWAAKVNPGGQVSAVRIDHGPPEYVALYPRLTLMDRATIERLEPKELTE